MNVIHFLEKYRKLNNFLKFLLNKYILSDNFNTFSSSLNKKHSEERCTLPRLLKWSY